MSTPDVSMTDSQVPAQNPVPGTTAVVSQARDLRAERDVEAARNKAEADKKASRFMARKMTVPDRPVAAAPEYENLMFESAVNNPFADLRNPSPSSFIPNFSVMFYLLAYMDHTMAGTKRWLDNCLGWAPPISQMYIAVLCYYQTIRAMDAASALSPGSPLKTFLITFESIFPLSELWIPGPLVAAFRATSAFWPSASDRFGNVHPTLPSTPGWSATTLFSLADQNGQHVPSFHLPNISLFISRLHQIGNIAAAAADQATFSANLNGPLFIQSLFGVAVSGAEAEGPLLHGPGSAFLYSDNLAMWRNAYARINALSIPADLSAAPGANQSVVPDNWISFFRFDNNQHIWFGNCAAVMAKYCQFFNGSKPISEIMPNCSAAGAVKLRLALGSTIRDLPTRRAAVAQAAGPPAVAAVASHYVLRSNARVVLDGQIAIDDIPEAHVHAAVTYALNACSSNADQVESRRGPFWSLGPDVASRNTIEVLPGVLSTIVRKYHSDVRIHPDKQ